MPHWLAKVVDLLNADTADLRELARLAGGDPRTFYLGINPENLDLAGQDLRGIEFQRSVETRVARIRSAKSKEERLARLVADILENREDGLKIIDSYRADVSEYASKALAEIRKTLARQEQAGRIDNLALVRAIRKPLSHQLGDSRANLLYQLVRYFHQYPEIKPYLQRSYARTTTKHIDRRRAEIEKLLF